MSDADLRERFQALREEEAATAPPFVLPHPRAVAPWRVPVWAAAVLVAAVGVLWLGEGRERTGARSDLIDLGAAVWVAPTDFLLETPGSELLRSYPAIGSTDMPAGVGAAVEGETDTTTREDYS